MHLSGEDVSGEQQAARFFIEQVLMSHSAGHYHVLGVDPDARPEEIKEHHRLLMRLFHPDRQTTPDAQSDAIATRINQAYTVLRYPDTRATYDLTLAEKTEGDDPRATLPGPPAGYRHPRPAAADADIRGSPPAPVRPR